MTTRKLDEELATDQNEKSSGAPERRPYTTPRLRHLGSVRELTLGGTMGASEGGGTFNPKSKSKM
jgi:hypothetical protein